MKFHIVTFGCAANTADSERIVSYYIHRGYRKTESLDDANDVVINTCMIRQMAEDRIYGLVHKLSEMKKNGKKIRVIITGCMVGMAIRDKSGKLLTQLHRRMPTVDDFLPIEEIGYEHAPLRSDDSHAFIPISNGCNNFCTYCVVPYSRGREISRPYKVIVDECAHLIHDGYKRLTLLGQNVNSYGSDIVMKLKKVRSDKQKNKTANNQLLSGITYVTHLGKSRIPTLFPQLLDEIASISSEVHIDFISSNPWDFSDDLIEVIRKHSNISRNIHLPVQSGDDTILKKMNRWYTRDEYMGLIKKIKEKIEDVSFSTDIIVGFCGETEEQFQHTVDLVRAVGFYKAYVSMYSDRPMTTAHKHFYDDVPYGEKKRRWKILEDLINKAYQNNSIV